MKNINLIFSNRNRFTLFSLLALLNVVFRLPWTSHEIGTDTFYIHGLAASISRFGAAKWLIHPASVFGLYPFSYPSSQPFILSGLSQASGISIESTLLLYSILLSLLGLFSSFILAKEIFKDDLYAFITSFLYSISPIFFELTYWQASTRSLFLSIFPLIIWTFLKNKNKLRVKYLMVSFIGIIFLFSAHRVAVFSLFSIVAYILAIIFYYLLKKRIIDLSSVVTRISVFYILLTLSLILFLSQFTSFGVFDLEPYQTGLFLNGDDFFTLLINMVADYTGKIGILLSLIFVGFLKIAKGAEDRFEELFILFNFILLLPLMGSDTYSPIPLSIFLVIFTAAGTITTIKYLSSKRLSWILINPNNWPEVFKKYIKNSQKSGVYKNSPLFIFAFIIVISVSFSLFMIYQGHLNTDSVSDQTIASANFIKDRSNCTVIANTGSLASEINAYSSVPVLPLGGPYAQFVPPGLLAYGFVDKTEFDVMSINISEINPDDKALYSLKSSRNANDEWTTIMERTYWSNESIDMRSKYNSNLVIDTGSSGKYLYWSWRPSSFLTSLYESGNKIYANNGETIYSLPEDVWV